MRPAFARRLAVSTLLIAVPCASAASAAEQYWGQWRGPQANGVAPHADPPTAWSETQNVRWKAPLPGGGHATPIVWGDNVYVQVAIKTDKLADSAAELPGPEAGKGDAQPARQPRARGGRRGNRGNSQPTHLYDFAVLAIDRKTGKTLWQKTVREELPHEAGHNDASQASNSPLTDGERLYAYFGSRGLYCMNLATGDVLWEKDFGDMHTRNNFGEGSSPVLAGDTLVVNWDHEGESFIVALDKKTGTERWRQARDEVTSWNTPLVVDAPSGPQVVVTGTTRVRGYAVATGKVVWECAGLGVNCIPSPVVLDDLVFAMAGFRADNCMAIRYRSAAGDITGSPAIAWSRQEGIPYVPSPLLYDGTLYLLQKNKGVLSVVDARTGQDRYERQRLEKISGVYASPVAAAGRVYVLGRNGATYVLAHGPEFKVLAVNELDGDFDASPAIADGELYLRSHDNLYCIAAN